MSRSFRTVSTVEEGSLSLALAPGISPAGPVMQPSFFHGFAIRPRTVSRGLLILAQIASTRYYQPRTEPDYDPVLSAHGDRLRAEVLSACNGVYACLELHASGLDGGEIGLGTTNVDLSPQTRAFLRELRTTEPLHLDVGTEGLRAASMTGSAVERPVQMPGRWLRGLANVAQIHRDMEARFQVDATTARRFVSGLPSHAAASGTGHFSPSRTGIRRRALPSTESVYIAGLQRLSSLKTLLPEVRGMTFYGPRSPQGEEQECAVVVELAEATLTLGLTGTVWRGYSGEGSLLSHAATATAPQDANLLSALLAFEPSIEISRLVRDAAMSAERVHDGLAVLAADGRVGWDLREGAYFHRELPSEPSRLEKDNPRLAKARALVEDGNVTHVRDEQYEVTSGARRYMVWVPDTARAGAVEPDESSTCTCTWFLRTGGERGPCAHVLAVLVSLGAEPQTSRRNLELSRSST